MMRKECDIWLYVSVSIRMSFGTWFYFFDLMRMAPGSLMLKKGKYPACQSMLETHGKENMIVKRKLK